MTAKQIFKYNSIGIGFWQNNQKSKTKTIQDDAETEISEEGAANQNDLEIADLDEKLKKAKLEANQRVSKSNHWDSGKICKL